MGQLLLILRSLRLQFFLCSFFAFSWLLFFCNDINKFKIYTYMENLFGSLSIQHKRMARCQSESLRCNQIHKADVCNKYAARLQLSLMNLMRAPNSCPEREIAPLVAGPFPKSKTPRVGRRAKTHSFLVFFSFWVFPVPVEDF